MSSVTADPARVSYYLRRISDGIELPTAFSEDDTRPYERAASERIDRRPTGGRTHGLMSKASWWDPDTVAAALRALHQGGARNARPWPHDQQATTSRSALEADAETVSVDELSGPYRRTGGEFPQIQRQITRARRSEEPCLLAVVDVDGLSFDDYEDRYRPCDRASLRVVAKTLRSLLRRYDCIVRFSDTEFLCVIVGLNMPSATSRFELIRSMVAVKPQPASVTVGLEMMDTQDSLDELAIRRKVTSCRHRQHNHDLKPRSR